MSTLAPTAVAPKVDTVGWVALLVGTGIIAWSGILVRFLDVGPLAGAAWRMGLAVPALAVWARLARGRSGATGDPPLSLAAALAQASPSRSTSARSTFR